MVFNTDNRMLAILRLGKWDLPKGHVEYNETIKSAAIREVEEECGISNPEIEEELVSTYHTYWIKKRWMLKRTYWFRMKYKGKETLVAQTDEDIEKAMWLSKNDMDKL